MPTILRVAQNFDSPYDATSLPAHFAKTTTTVCVCAHIVSPIDGTVIGITSLSQNLTSIPGYPGVTFKSTSGMSASNVEAQQGQAATNMEADLFLITAGITEADALAGKWSHALTTIFLMNYEAPKMGQYIIQKGHLGQFVQRGQLLSVEVMGFNQALTQNYGKVTRPECSRTYGDALCTLDLAARGEIKTGTLTGVTSQTAFTDSGRSEADDYFGNGEFTWTGGNNSGYTFHIDGYNGTTKTFTLRTPTPYMPVIGDTYSAKRGCRKRPADCLNRGNTINADFFPWIPTQEEMSRLPTVQ